MAAIKSYLLSSQGLLLDMSFDFELDVLDYILIIGSIISGVIHLYEGFISGFTLLVLAGIGFSGFVVLYSADFYRKLIAAGLIPFVVAQFFFYYRFYGFSFGPIAVFDKLVQLVLVLAAVFYLYRDLEGFRW